jgi:hypothetical protein
VNRRTFLRQAASGAAATLVPVSVFAQTPPGLRFVDVTGPAGIRFRHNSGAYGGKLLPETMGSGCAFLDYDADGWQDILLVNGRDWPGRTRRRSTLALYLRPGCTAGDLSHVKFAPVCRPA